MQVADEKRIINALGSYMPITSSQAGQVRPEQFYADQTAHEHFNLRGCKKLERKNES